MIPQEIIRAKRDKKKLSNEEIKIFVDGITSGEFSDSQIAAMSMAILVNGMDKEETAELTRCMTHSGEILTWKNLSNPELVCDKHSTGGVGDKVSLILAPILAACGLYVPMISGRGLGHTGGTLDKFDAIPGYNTQPDIETFKQVVKNVGCAIIGQTPSLAPADKKLYSIRDIVGTVESLPLITSSILSKKIASGLNSLVLDVKVGNGSFNTTEEIARSLANSLVSVAQDAGIKCEAILTDMNQVLGHSAGHALEMKESIEYLTNSFKNPRLEQITNELATSLLVQSCDYSKKEAILKINSAVNSGKAAEKFEMMVSALGGDKNILSNYNNLLGNSNFRGDILSNKEGYVTKIKTRKLGLILIEMGGGRKKITDKIDYSVGFINVTSLNDEIQSGKPLVSVYTKSENDFKKLEKNLIDCFVIENKQITNKTIIDIIN
jgi:thymidine phosphorylase